MRKKGESVSEVTILAENNGVAGCFQRFFKTNLCFGQNLEGFFLGFFPSKFVLLFRLLFCSLNTYFLNDVSIVIHHNACFVKTQISEFFSDISNENEAIIRINQPGVARFTKLKSNQKSAIEAFVQHFRVSDGHVQ